MEKDFIENYFRERLINDGFKTDNNDNIFRINLLKRKNERAGDVVNYGFSVFVFGTLALKANYRGKWSNSFLISRHCQKINNFDAIQYGDGDFFYVMINNDNDKKEVLTAIYDYCVSNVKKEFDCCSRYIECSDAMKCLNPCRSRSVFCGYRKKLEKGIVFYGKNRNI